MFFVVFILIGSLRPSMFLFYFFWEIQVEETNEAREKFSNAKSISSAQFFGDQNKSKDVEAQASLQKYSVCPENLFWLFSFDSISLSLALFLLVS